MRCTVDIDNHNIFGLFGVFLRGLVLCRRFPYYFKLTRRGFHIAWRGLDITEDEMFRYRFILGDDEKRLELDMLSDKRVKQVMFTDKKCYSINWKNGVYIEQRIR